MSHPPTPIVKLMKAPLVFVGTDTTAQQARELAAEHGLHYLPVRQGDILVGTVCARDLHGVPPEAPVATSMRREVATLPHTASAAEAAELMRRSGSASIVVLENGEPCGMLTRGDVAEWDWEADAVLPVQRCQRCGLAEQLFKEEDGRLLCTACLHGGEKALPASHGKGA